KSGNLWVASSPKILEYAASSLSASGSPAPAMTLTLPSGASSPETSGIAFDESGDLWYLDTFNAAIGEYTAAQLAGGGSPLPTVTLTNSANFYGEGLAFNPHPSAVPLH
ncbi:MAG TPA: hypothetical protein VK679_09285, partial [Gemmatimonadaceae bacterium]|nr:hypothetical protein [Gemmatimonadaceae bacterium]